MAERQYSQTEKNMIFAQLTRQNIQREPQFTIEESKTYRFSLPQTRYTSGIKLLITGTFDVTHSSATTWTPARFAPYNLVSNIKVDLNNGFAPYSVSGVGAYINSLARPNNTPFLTNETTATNRGLSKIAPATGSASSSGATNTIQLVYDLPLVINERDPIGLIMTQDSETHVTVEFSMGTILDMFSSATGYSIDNISLICQPVIESYTIPVNPIASNPNTPLVDLNTVKLVQEQTFTVSATGEYIVRLPIGTTYRRVFLDLSSSGTALTDANVSSIQVKLNQADVPYSFTGQQLSTINELQLGNPLPLGLFMFDFTYLGFVNYGGSRDYIDTDGLNEFWIVLTLGATGTIKTVYESLVRLANA
jgi:hypothetical protein